MIYDIGDVVKLTGDFGPSADVYADPTEVTLIVKAPDGTTTSPAPVKDSTGRYHFDLYVDQAGVWAYQWRGDGAPGTLRGRGEKRFSVKASGF